VQKYGGSSVADAEGIKRVAKRIVATKQAGNQVVVVVSAMGDTTDELMDLAGTSEMDVALSEWMLEQVHKHTRNWKTLGLQTVPVGLKASLAHIQLRDLNLLVNAAISNGMDPRQITLELTPAAKELLVREGYDPAYGARPLRRTIQRLVQDPLALQRIELRMISSILARRQPPVAAAASR